MKTIKRRILAPLLSIIILLPLLILLFFNLAMQAYIERSARDELQNTVTTMNVLIQRQLMSALTDASADEELSKTLTGLSAALTATKFTANTQFFLFDADGTPVFPRDLSKTLLTDTLLEKIQPYLDTGGEIHRIAFEGQRYFAASAKLTGVSDTHPPSMVFISGINAAESVLRVVNIILIAIILFAISVSTLIAALISRSISRPIQNACGYAKTISGGAFVQMPVDNSSQEISEFCTSINEMSQRLKAYDTAQKTFLQNASHELRTPLMSIQGYAEGILSGVFEDNHRAARIICDESKRLNTLVEELLTLSRIENQTYKGELVPANLANLLKEYVQRMGGFALKEQKQLLLTLIDTPLTAVVDDSLLAQTIINVLSNGIRYANRRVELSLTREGENALITIRDDGNGFEEQELPHLFERFYKGKNGNFGLGLAIAKSATDYMGGNIRAHNDGGAVFEIRLPCYATDG